MFRLLMIKIKNPPITHVRMKGSMYHIGGGGQARIEHISRLPETFIKDNKTCGGDQWEVIGPSSSTYREPDALLLRSGKNDVTV